MTTFKEFFEVFIASVRHEYRLHKDLMEPCYNYIGLALSYEDQTFMTLSNRSSTNFGGVVSVSTPAKLMILLAESKQTKR